MPPPVIVTIRYSILSRDARAWEISRDRDFAAYRAALFDPMRLATKLRLFESVVLASLAAQTDTENLHVVVITSRDLPAAHLAGLRQAMARHSWARLVQIAPDEKVGHDAHVRDVLKAQGGGLYAHLRLDDDDGLARDYIARLRREICARNVGRAVSFALGFGGIYDEARGRFREFRTLYYPKISCGLAVINRYDPDSNGFGHAAANAYGLGAHTRVDRTVPLILDATWPAFVYAIYDTQDTASKFLKVVGDPVPEDQVRSAVGLAGGVGPDTAPPG